MLKIYLKSTLSLFIMCCIAFSCSKSPKSEIQEAIEKIILPQLDDPSSYEFASLQILDTIKYEDNINHDKFLFEKTINDNNDIISRFKKIHQRENEEVLNFRLSNEMSAVRVYSKAIEILDSIENGIQTDKICAYTCCYKFRSNNGLGNLTLNTLYIEISPLLQNYNILNIQNEIEKLSPTPGDYPNKKLVDQQIEKYKSPEEILNQFRNALK